MKKGELTGGCGYLTLKIIVILFLICQSVFGQSQMDSAKMDIRFVLGNIIGGSFIERDSIIVLSDGTFKLQHTPYIPCYPTDFNYKDRMPTMPGYPNMTLEQLSAMPSMPGYSKNIELPELQYNFDPIVPEKRWRLSEPAKIILIFSSSVILEAIGDAKYDEGEKEIGKLFQAASVGLLVASPILLDIDKSKWGWYLASYISMRVALFDPVYNLSRGLHMGYTGNTSFWDKGIQAFNPPQGMKIFGHSVAFIFAISIPLNHF